MLSSITVSLIALICIIFFILYKRNLIPRILPDNSTVMNNQFKEQLEKTADTVLAQLENKIIHLESLLNEADLRIIELEKQLKALDATTMLIDQNSDRIVDSYIPSHEMNIGRETAQRQADIADNDQADAVKVLPEEDDKRRLVLAMAEQGYNITEIAKATGKGKGEIMLLLQLNKR